VFLFTADVAKLYPKIIYCRFAMILIHGRQMWMSGGWWLVAKSQSVSKAPYKPFIARDHGNQRNTY
jgi:hypothetical protein